MLKIHLTNIAILTKTEAVAKLIFFVTASDKFKSLFIIPNGLLQSSLYKFHTARVPCIFHRGIIH